MEDFIRVTTDPILDKFNADYDAFDCPTCGRVVALYKRTLHKSIIEQLINLYNAGGHLAHIHSNNFIQGKKGMDFAIARHWGLIEREANTDKKKATSGRWKLTFKGMSFLNGLLDIPKYAYLCDDKLQAISETTGKIQEFLPQTFDYSTIKPRFNIV